MDRWGVEMSEQPSSKVRKDSSPCSQVLAAAEEIANAIGQLCAAQGGIADIGSIKRKTAATIDRHTRHTEMRATCQEMEEALIGIRDNSHDEAATARIECDVLFSELARQYTEIKLCYDEEDGFFIQRESGYDVDSWVTMDMADAPRRETIADAVIAAVDWHNADLRPYMEWRKPISLPENRKEHTK